VLAVHLSSQQGNTDTYDATTDRTVLMKENRRPYHATLRV
jgi:hypothetical protein